MTDVTLFFLRPNLGGGTTSYTIHMVHALRAAGATVRLVRVKPKGEHFTRKFGAHDDIEYQNITLEDALKLAKKTPSLMTAPSNSKYLHDPDLIAKLMRAGMRITIHDPNEFEIYDHLGNKKLIRQPFCIRPSMKQQFFKDAVYIPHPYKRFYQNEQPTGELSAVSVARVTFVKRTHIILEANRALAPPKRVVLRGWENRLYTRHVLCKKFPEFKQGTTGFPMGPDAAAKECHRAHFAVDLTYFPNDGGGSQYSFMEAWDAGSVNIVHRDWLRYKGEMKDDWNCHGIEDAKELAAYLDRCTKRERLRVQANGWKSLKAHDPKVVGRQYLKELLK